MGKQSKTGNKQVAEYGKKTRFKPGQSGNPGGRPRKLLTIAAGLHQGGLSRSQLNDMIKALGGMTLNELKAVATDPKSLALEVAVANAIRNDIQNGRLQNVETVLSRSFGTPRQEVILNSTSTIRNVQISMPDNEKSDESPDKL